MFAGYGIGVSAVPDLRRRFPRAPPELPGNDYRDYTISGEAARELPLLEQLPLLATRSPAHPAAAVPGHFQLSSRV